MKKCPICDFQFQDELDQCPRHAVELSPVDDPLLGTHIRDKYKLTQIIGRGSMGVVYRASLEGAPDVAIKVLHTHLTANRESLKRFHHEAKAASRLRHPHIVSVFDVGVVPGGQPYIAMELLPGKTLAQFMKKNRFLDPPDALPIMRQVCEALTEAHSHGVVHRDIKPANIMLQDRYGQQNFVVVVDFSIAKVIQRVSDVESTTPGLIFGSPAYMSPERFMGRGGDFRSDIYSTGIILFQMLAGVPPFRSGDLYSLMNEHVKTPPPRVKSVRPDAPVSDMLEDTIARALAKRPEDRQENMRQLLHELSNAILEGQPGNSSGGGMPALHQFSPAAVPVFHPVQEGSPFGDDDDLDLPFAADRQDDDESQEASVRQQTEELPEPMSVEEIISSSRLAAITSQKLAALANQSAGKEDASQLSSSQSPVGEAAISEQRSEHISGHAAANIAPDSGRASATESTTHSPEPAVSRAQEAGSARAQEPPSARAQEPTESYEHYEPDEIPIRTPPALQVSGARSTVEPAPFGTHSESKVTSGRAFGPRETMALMPIIILSAGIIGVIIFLSQVPRQPLDAQVAAAMKRHDLDDAGRALQSWQYDQPLRRRFSYEFDKSCVELAQEYMKMNKAEGFRKALIYLELIAPPSKFYRRALEMRRECIKAKKAYD